VRNWATRTTQAINDLPLNRAVTPFVPLDGRPAREQLGSATRSAARVTKSGLWCRINGIRNGTTRINPRRIHSQDNECVTRILLPLCDFIQSSRCSRAAAMTTWDGLRGTGTGDEVRRK
jgi:hypothetical protein